MEKIFKHTYFTTSSLIITILLLLPLLYSCNNDEDNSWEEKEKPIEDQVETVVVPLTVSVASVWDIDIDNETKAAPPGTGGNTGTTDNSDDTSMDNGLEELEPVNEVQIIVFRRKTTDITNPDKIAGFVHDHPNDQILLPYPKDGSIDDKFGSSDTHDKKNHKVFTGEIKKTFGYEYKVIAIAYGSDSKSSFRDSYNNLLFNMKDGDKNKFNFDFGKDNTLEQFKAKMGYQKFNSNDNLWKNFYGTYAGTATDDIAPEGRLRNYMLNNYATEIPQIFYTECSTSFEGKKKEIISFSETNSNGENISNLPISGVLFRGMAEVEVRIENPTKHSDKAYKWIALLADNVSTEVGLSNYDEFLPGASGMSSEIENRTKNGVFTLVGYKTLSSTDNNQVLRAFLLPGKTRLALRGYHDYTIDVREYHNPLFKHADQDWTDAVNGTGIVSPDIYGDEFYLRRNHKYILIIKDLDKFMNAKENVIPYKI